MLTALMMLIALPAGAADIIAQQEIIAFDAGAAPPVEMSTRIPAKAGWTQGPGDGPALTVTVPDIDKEEKACAFVLELPDIDPRFNAISLQVRGSELTRRLEIGFITPEGGYGADVPLEKTWRTVTLGAHNTGPLWSTKDGALKPSTARQLRLCFGAWQGHRSGPHEVSIADIRAVQSPLFAPLPAVEEIDKPRAALPLQPFTVELLDLGRTQWRFVGALGSRLELEGSLDAYAFTSASVQDLKLAYLLCDPEYPEELSHAILKLAPPVQAEADKAWFRMREPFLACGLAVERVAPGALGCRIEDIGLERARQGERYVAAMYLVAGDKMAPLWLAPGKDTDGLCLRMLTDRVGHIFSEGEPVRVHIAGLCLSQDAPVTVHLTVTDYATGRQVWQGDETLPCAAGSATLRPRTLPLDRFGILEVEAVAGQQRARLRVCRIPRPREVPPDESCIGINIFQQQVWWYAHQAPMMAKAGVHWIRPWLAWENTWRMQEPQEGAWHPDALDAALRRMEKFGLRYEYILFSAPQWLAGGARSGAPPADRMDEWAAYVRKLVTRYRGRIKHYEVWNEPDLMWPETTRHQGEHYVQMLKATYEAAKQADPECVIHGLSHAGYEQWLRRVGELGAGKYMDLATVHTYAAPNEFVAHMSRRREIIDYYGMADKPMWVNEFGATAYDFSPEYSAKMRCSEANQAHVLTANYAQALSFGPDTKAFWFCTYDPRDPAHESQWTWDAGIGVLYIGFLPKLSYAALAAVARQLDGKECLGRARIGRYLSQVSFEGPVAVVWHDRPEGIEPVPATQLGCLPDEQITIRDMFTNPVASGRAGDIAVDMSGGAVYLEGSRQMAGLARTQRAVAIEPAYLRLSPGQTVRARLAMPPGAGATLDAEPGLPVKATLSPEEEALTVTAPQNAGRASGRLRLTAKLPVGVLGLLAATEVTREVSVRIGRPNLIRDGGFFAGNLLEWTPERTSPCRWDPDEGHSAPGCVRLDGPFDRRLVHWGADPKPDGAVRIRCWVKTEQIEGCLATLNLALFGAKGWIKTWCIATNGGPEADLGGALLMAGHAKLPSGSSPWTVIDVTLEADLIPPETTRGAFFIDVKGGAKGSLWLDDVDVWQPDVEPLPEPIP